MEYFDPANNEDGYWGEWLDTGHCMIEALVSAELVDDLDDAVATLERDTGSIDAVAMIADCWALIAKTMSRVDSDLVCRAVNVQELGCVPAHALAFADWNLLGLIVDQVAMNYEPFCTKLECALQPRHCDSVASALLELVNASIALHTNIYDALHKPELRVVVDRSKAWADLAELATVLGRELKTAAAAAVDHQRSTLALTGEFREWKNARWFEDRTRKNDKYLSGDTLRKAATAKPVPRIRRKPYGHRWRYNVDDVRREWPELAHLLIDQ